jgi:hypothetical protein
MFSYDVTQPIGLIRLMLGDTDQTKVNFQDEELNALLNLVTSQVSGPTVPFGSGGSLTNDVVCFTCAAALESLAAKIAASANGRTYQLGDFRITGKDQVTSLQEQATRWRAAVENAPAWAIVEENNSGFNELTIIRNWVLRTEV